MLERLWPHILAAFVFAGVFVLVAGSQRDTLARQAHASAELCYQLRGYPLDRRMTGSVPYAVDEECARPTRALATAKGPWYAAAGAGFGAALIALLLGMGLRRRLRRPTEPM